jgi:CDGSH-type Zn-finger protein
MTSVVVHSAENGPNLVMVDGKVKVALCRCGQSSRKPMCDGTHQKMGFKGPKAETAILP